MTVFAGIIRDIESGDRAPLAEMLTHVREFDDEEVEVALELIDHAINKTDDYRVLVAVLSARKAGSERSEREGQTPPRSHPSEASGDEDSPRVSGARAPDVTGYLCYGPTPMTRSTYDLYWIATDPRLRRSGVGKALVETLDARLRAEGGRLVRLETSSRDDYAATRAFYDRTGFRVLARITDFYSIGDDLLVYGKYY